MSDDPESLRLLGLVIEKQQDYRRAVEHLREHLSGKRNADAVQVSPPSKAKRTIGILNPESISQRCLKVLTDSPGKNIATETIASKVGVEVVQVRGALKRFVNEHVITKPRRGLWRYDISRNRQVDRTEQLPLKG